MNFIKTHLSIIKGILKWILIVIATFLFLYFSVYQSIQRANIKLQIEAQQLQIQKVELLLKGDCFKDEERKTECWKLFEAFGVVLPKK